jgi:hypothetical protein
MYHLHSLMINIDFSELPIYFCLEHSTAFWFAGDFVNFFGSNRVWTQGPLLPRQTLYHLNIGWPGLQSSYLSFPCNWKDWCGPPCPTFYWLRWDLTVFLGWPWPAILPISTFRVARIQAWPTVPSWDFVILNGIFSCSYDSEFLTSIQQLFTTDILHASLYAGFRVREMSKTQTLHKDTYS